MISEQLAHFKPFLVVVSVLVVDGFIGWTMNDLGSIANVLKEFFGALAMAITLGYAVVRVIKDILKWKQGKKESETR